jgi:hypothetical protein
MRNITGNSIWRGEKERPGLRAKRMIHWYIDKLYLNSVLFNLTTKIRVVPNCQYIGINESGIKSIILVVKALL